MAFASRVLALGLLTLPNAGCATIELMEAARMHERVLRYERIALVDGEIHLDYAAEIGTAPSAIDRVDAEAGSSTTVQRGATFALSELTVRPAYPVDAFPLTRVDADSEAGPSLPISLNGDWTDGDSAGTLASRAPYFVRIDEEEGRHRGFRLCPTSGGPCLEYFYSAALYDDPIAWWAYPISPFTFAIDVALLPIQVFSIPILIAVGD